jgi:hypothetical protein
MGDGMLLMYLLRRGNFCSNVNPVGTTVKQNGCYSGILKHLLFEYLAGLLPRVQP